MQVPSLSREDPPEERTAPTPVLLPRESHGERSLAGCSPWGCKNRTDLATKTYQTILIRNITKDTHHQTSVQAHRTYITKSEP